MSATQCLLTMFHYHIINSAKTTAAARTPEEEALAREQTREAMAKVERCIDRALAIAGAVRPLMCHAVFPGLQACLVDGELLSCRPRARRALFWQTRVRCYTIWWTKWLRATHP